MSGLSVEATHSYIRCTGTRCARPDARGQTRMEEEHVFRFARRDGRWVMSHHHEITLEEMHQAEVVRRLRNPCGASE